MKDSNRRESQRNAQTPQLSPHRSSRLRIFLSFPFSFTKTTTHQEVRRHMFHHCKLSTLSVHSQIDDTPPWFLMYQWRNHFLQWNTWRLKLEIFNEQLEKNTWNTILVFDWFNWILWKIYHKYSFLEFVFLYISYKNYLELRILSSLKHCFFNTNWHTSFFVGNFTFKFLSPISIAIFCSF